MHKIDVRTAIIPNRTLSFKRAVLLSLTKMRLRAAVLMTAGIALVAVIHEIPNSNVALDIAVSSGKVLIRVTNRGLMHAFETTNGSVKENIEAVALARRRKL